MSAKFVPSVSRPTQEEIGRAAFLIWLEEGCPEGRAAAHWVDAETQLLADRLQEAAVTTSPKDIAQAINRALGLDQKQKRMTKSGKMLPR